MTKDLVTVVVPAYNHDKYVISAIESVLAQDYPNIELIVINDGSTDSTDRLIKDFLSDRGSSPDSDDVFKYISKKNEGVGMTMALGLKEARGEYFAELCSDDLMTESSITNRVKFLKENKDIDIVYGTLASIDSKGQILDKPSKLKKNYNSSEHNLKDLVEGRATFSIHAGLYRADRLRSFGGFREGFFTEDVFLRFFLPLVANIASIDYDVVSYRRHDTNISSGKPLWMRQEKVKSLELILELEEVPNAEKPYVKELLFKEYLKYLKAGLRAGVEKKELQNIVSRALNIKPLSPKALMYKLRLL